MQYLIYFVKGMVKLPIVLVSVILWLIMSPPLILISIIIGLRGDGDVNWIDWWADFLFDNKLLNW